MLGDSSRTRIPLPKPWPSRVRSGVLHAISLARFSLIYTRSWAANSWNARIRLKQENDRLRQEVAGEMPVEQAPEKVEEDTAGEQPGKGQVPQPRDCEIVSGGDRCPPRKGPAFGLSVRRLPDAEHASGRNP